MMNEPDDAMTEMLNGIRRGMDDALAGRTRPADEVLKELGLQPTR